MARPKKNNADYFPHDSGLRNDRKVKALRSKFGHVGYSVYVMLIESLTDADFFELEFDEIGVELLAGDFDVESGELENIVKYCSFLGLIQCEDDCKKIWSDRHKKNFDGLLRKRKRDRTEVIADGNPVIADENPQSRVKKKKEEKTYIVFDEFYKHFPKKKGKAAAEKAWVKLKVEGDLFKTILSSLEKQKQSDDWKKDNGQFIPYPATWLNGKRWEDEDCGAQSKTCETCDYKSRGACNKKEVCSSWRQII